MSKTYLFVVAHPDDEIFGGGATIKTLTDRGNKVYVCILNSESLIRCSDSEQMINEMYDTHTKLGISNVAVGTFPNLEFNTVPHVKLVQFIEKAIRSFRPDVVVTHHPSDLHNDHQMVSAACQVAVRLPQRQTGYDHTIQAFYFMEIPASTDWGTSVSTGSFTPTQYVPITGQDFNLKMNLLSLYSEGKVLREYPHPRSRGIMHALAAKRGSEIGCDYAEAFQQVFSREII